MPFESLGVVSYSASIVTISISVAVCEVFNVKEWCDYENRSALVQGHWKWHHLIDRKGRGGARACPPPLHIISGYATGSSDPYSSCNEMRVID